MRKFILNNWLIILLLIVSGLTLWPLFKPGYFYQHDGLQIIRIFEMRRCFADFQLPCRWVPDMGFGNGYPLFNYYGILPYYIGGLASYLIGYIWAAKFMFFIPLIIGSFGMYFLAKDLYGKIPGFVSAILFTFAPYRSVDTYVRGAVGESFGMNLIPFVLYFWLKTIRERKANYLIMAIISTFLFFISHNIMVLIFSPVIATWILFWLWKGKWKPYKFALLGLGVAFGLSSFFIIPAFFEKGLVQTNTLITGYYDFRNHFAAVFQLFTDRFWGYGGSVQGIDDQLSFQIGWPHWWLVAGGALFVLLKKNKNRYLAILLLAVFFLSTFMIHGKSAFIWEGIKLLAFVQFPWRFLSIVIVSASLLGGYFVSNLKGKSLYLLSASVVALTIAFNWAYFKPGVFEYNLTDKEELTGQNWIGQQGGAVLDYLPITASEPKSLAPTSPKLIVGAGTINLFENKSNLWKFNADISKNATIEVPVFDFPGWTVTIDGVEVKHSAKGEIGRIAVSVPMGNHVIIGRFKNTPLRTFANTLTLLSFIGLIAIASWKKFNHS